MTATPSFRPRAWLLAAASVAALGSLVVLPSAAQTTGGTADIKPAQIATTPLYEATAGDRPTITLALSVEYPTVGAQYPTAADYTHEKEYLGYYNHEMCYEYDDDDGYFEIERKGTVSPGGGAWCGGEKEFSGNFLNWASSSAIDMFRMALSGGDRYIDKEDKTVLARAYLPDGTTGRWALRSANGGVSEGSAIPSFYGNAGMFVTKTLNVGMATKAEGGYTDESRYITEGAVPRKMVNWFRTNASRWAQIHIKNVRDVIYFTADGGEAEHGYWMKRLAEGTKLSGDNDFFYARVKVCDKKDERDYALCTEYPSGRKKPTGVIQRYADNLRVAAFGYAVDKSNPHGTGGEDSFARFGGVLRAPMKYVGPNVYGPTGIKLTDKNPRVEWDVETGQFIADPEGDDNPDRHFKLSGVINYLNRFGNARNGYGVAGAYKSADPVGELYYEVLRYLQGMGATRQAVYHLDDRMKDGQPVYTRQTAEDVDKVDPFGAELGYTPDADYTCLNNSIVLIGDNNTHDANGGDDNATKDDGTPNENRDKRRFTLAQSNDAKNIPNALSWRGVVHAFEQQKTLAYKDGSGKTRRTGGSTTAVVPQYPDLRPYSFVSGLAYWAHTHDIRGSAWTDTTEGNGNSSVDSKGRSKLRPGLRVQTFALNVNEARLETRYCKRAGTCDTGGEYYKPIRGNQFWLAAKYGGFNTQPRTAGSKDFNTQGNPFYQTECTKGADGQETCTRLTTRSNAIWSDLVKAQGDNTDPVGQPEPRNYYMPENGRAVLAAFDEIFSQQPPLAQRSVAGADSVGGLGGTSFQATFDGATWSGDVLAEGVPVCTRYGTDGGCAEWSDRTTAWCASDALATLGHANRKIFMGAHDATSDSANTTAFEFKANTTGAGMGAVKAALQAGGCSDVDACINWLRGAQVEGLRTRGTSCQGAPNVLGDIINSGVKYVGAPSSAVNLGDYFANHVDDQRGRDRMLYVGANDGMLHAFRAKTYDANNNREVDSDGTELFAYIPSWMRDRLADLTMEPYAHQAYVDATPVIGDAKLRDSVVTGTGANMQVTDSGWGTVLVGGTGGGGKGVYALDVTDPAAFDASKVLWEFTDADDPDMGYVLGQARIVKLYTGDVQDTTTTPPSTKRGYRWFAMVPAGVNNYVGSGTATGGNGDANIFLLALDKAAGAKWEQGSNYWKLRLPRIQALEATHPTGILNLEAFTGVGGVTEYVYAGDLHGQLWAFSFKDMVPSDWTEIKLSNLYNNGVAIKPLFIARNADGEAQPITVAPTILEGAGNGVHFVSFGTGKYFEPGDANTTKIDSFYSVYSNFNTAAGDEVDTATHTTFGSLRNHGDAIIPGRSHLQQVTQEATDSEGTTNYRPTQAFYWGWLGSAPTGNETSNKRSGWYLDFAADGEREVADASWISLTSRLMFSTLTPTSATNTGVCGTGGGTSRIYTFDMVSGKGISRASEVGILAQPLVFLDIANMNETEADSTGRRLRITPVVSGQFGAEGSAVKQVDTVIVPFGRLSWRRIDNFQELKHEAEQ